MKQNAEEVISQLLKTNESLQRGNSDSFKYSRIPFNIPVLDKLTGGGIPKKRFTLIYGPTNVGKSYLASQIVVNVQKEGGTATWVDTELSWDSEWSEKCGIDTNNILVATPTNGEEALKVVRDSMQLGVDVIVLDSIAGLVPTTVAEEEFSYNPMAWQARFINSALPKLLPSLHHGSAFVAINQVRASLGNVSIDNMPGGLAQTFFAHFLLQVKRSGWIKESSAENAPKVGFDMEIRLRKTKVGGENWKAATVPFRVEGGIDIVESYIREGIEQNLIEKKKSWYKYKDNNTQGMNGLKALFLEKPELLEQLQNELTT